MKTCLVSLIGDQTIPNILVAAHFQPDFQLFISTRRMEEKGKSKAILDTLKLRGLDYEERHQVLEVSEDSILDLQNQVAGWLSETGEEFQFIVNLTGGNKLMSIATFDLFTDFGSEMVYVPIPKNEYLKPFPKRRPKHPTRLTERLSVEEYLCGYGFKVKNHAQLQQNKEMALLRRSTTCHVFDHYLETRSLLRWFRASMAPLKRRALKKGHDFSGHFEVQNPAQSHLLTALGFSRSGTEIRKTIFEADWNYLRGGWLEERLYLAVREVLPSPTDIQLGLQCEDPKGNRNEFDVILVHANVLSLIECKSLDAAEGSDDIVGANINDFLYKLGALRQNFGLTPEAFLATTSESTLGDDGRVKPRLAERGRQFRTEIVPLLKIDNLEGFFRDRFSKST